MKKKSILILILLCLSLIFFYLKSFNSFLFQDDFFNLKLAQQHNLVDAFNLLKRPILDFYFYRPFSTQLYWYIGQKLFGFLPLGYHLVNFTFFIASIFLVYKLSQILLKNEKAALLASFFYAYSGSHFYRLFFISQFQELSLAVFTFLCLWFFLKKSILTPLIFILALTTKETAVMIVPAMFALIVFFESDKKSWRNFFICLGILIFYIFARVKFFGFSQGGVYQFEFGPKKVLNNYFWYSLWSLGVPEAFVNIKIFKLPTLINPKLFTAFGVLGNYTTLFFALFVAIIFKPVIDIFKKIDKKLILSGGFFVGFLLPVAFFPFHKFPYSLTVPLLGSSMILGYAVSNVKNSKLILICVVYFLLALSGYRFNLLNHWAAKKPKVVEKAFSYFKSQCPKKISNVVYFRNTVFPVCLVKKGLSYSREVSYAVGGEDGLRLLYNNPNLEIYFEDIDLFKHFNPNYMMVDSSGFIN